MQGLIEGQAQYNAEIIRKNQTFTKMLGTHILVKEFLLDRSEAKRKELLGIFSDYAKEDVKFLSIYLLDKNGVGLISTDERFVGQDYSFRNYFKRAILGESYIDVAVGKTSNKFGYYFSHPVKLIDGTIAGVLVVKIDNKEMDEAVLSSSVSKESTIMLTDQFGVILASNKTDRFLKSLGEITPENKEIIKQDERFLGQEIIPLQYSSTQKIVDNYTGREVIEFYDIKDKENEIVSVLKLDGFPFYLVLEIGVDKIENLVLSTVLLIISIFIIGILIGSFVIYKLVTRFTSPLDEFTALSKSIEMGDFSQRININTKDEFNSLANTFNRMSSSLENQYRNLETKVNERTYDLNKALAETKRLNKFMVGRELKMADLKKEAEELRAKIKN